MDPLKFPFHSHVGAWAEKRLRGCGGAVSAYCLSQAPHSARDISWCWMASWAVKKPADWRRKRGLLWIIPAKSTQTYWGLLDPWERQLTNHRMDMVSARGAMWTATMRSIKWGSLPWAAWERLGARRVWKPEQIHSQNISRYQQKFCPSKTLGARLAA